MGGGVAFGRLKGKVKGRRVVRGRRKKEKRCDGEK